MFHKLKQYNDLRKQANRLRGALSGEKVTIDNAAVTLVMDGNQEVKELRIKPEYLSSEQKGQLEKSIVQATNEATKKVQRLMATKMREMGDFKIPGLTA